MFSCRIKACDAIGDDEPPAFSDDEEEQAYYEMLKQKNKDCSDGKTSQKKHQTSECISNSIATIITQVYIINNYC